MKKILLVLTMMTIVSLYVSAQNKTYIPDDVFENYLETHNAEGKIVTRTNHSGGIQGGISNGMDIYFNVAFKPVATILRPQESVNNAGDAVIVEGKGRHDPCVLPRAVPIVEAMAALVLADYILLQKSYAV